MSTASTPLSGRRAEAARNDQRILEAARAVFVADPGAPIAAVAEHAGVGISALYRRYASKEELLRRLCGDGLKAYLAAAEEALADDGDPWEAFARFMRRVVDADTHSLTSRLAGTFTPTDELNRDADAGSGAQPAAVRADQGVGGHPARPRRQRPLDGVRAAGLDPPRRRGPDQPAPPPVPRPAARGHAPPLGRPPPRPPTDLAGAHRPLVAGPAPAAASR